MAAAVPLGKWSSTDDVIRAYLEEAKDISNQTIIVTGSNTGIGKETARVLASLGGNMVLACRNEEKANDAIRDLELTNANKDAPYKLTCIPVDLSSMDSINAFVRTFIQKKVELMWPPLRILILNAGIFALNGHSESVDGLESTFATNHLGNYLLTKLLLPYLRESPSARVVVVASDSHRGPLLSCDMTDKTAVMRHVAHCNKSNFSMIGAYGTSKLCNVLFSAALHDRESKAESSVVSCSLHPGTMIGTDIARGSWIADKFMRYIMPFFTKNINQGASTTILSCLRPHRDLQGKYFSDCAESEPSGLARNVAAQTVLWDISEELIDSK
ncbi:unnamed protein product, partial [Ectocarpus fasciculatus]